MQRYKVLGYIPITNQIYCRTTTAAPTTHTIKASVPCAQQGCHVSTPISYGIDILCDNDVTDYGYIIPVALDGSAADPQNRRYWSTDLMGYHASVIGQGFSNTAVGRNYASLVCQDTNILGCRKISGQLSSSFPGDFTIRDVNGGSGIFHGRYMTNIAESSFCSTIWTKLQNRVTTTAYNYERISPRSLTVADGYSDAHLYAYSAQEAFGDICKSSDSYVIHNIDIQKNFMGITDGKQELASLYRFGELHIPHVGKFSYVVRPADDYMEDDQPDYCYSMLFMHTFSVGMTGQTATTSIHSIRSIKSPNTTGFVYSEHQPYNQYLSKHYQDVEQTPEVVPLMLSTDYNPDANNAIRTLQTDTVDSYQSNVNRGNILYRYAEHKRYTKQRIKYGFQYDPQDDKIQLNSFGSKKVVYNNVSFISQQPDGSILITDGYGSQIRMCRGNIIISSALDTIIRPGRSLYAIIPGVTSIAAQKLILVARKELRQVAGNDMYLISGCRGSGCMFIRGLGEQSEYSIVVDSARTVNVSAWGMSIDSHTADIAIHTVGMNIQSSSNISVLSSAVLNIGVMQTKQFNGFIMSGNTCTLTCSAYVGGTVMCKKISGTLTVPMLKDNKIVNIQLNYKSREAPGLYAHQLITDTMLALQAIAIDGPIVAQSISTKSPISIAGNPFLTPITEESRQTIVAAMVQQTFQPLVVSSDKTTFEYTWEQLTVLPQSSWYPVQTDFYFAETVWQYNSQTSTVLIPLQITVDNQQFMEFPGKQIWKGETLHSAEIRDQDNQVSVKLLRKKAQDTYKINYKYK